MACHTAFEVDFYRQTAVVFSHSLGRKRTQFPLGTWENA
jgi:hypothetical protein